MTDSKPTTPPRDICGIRETLAEVEIQVRMLVRDESDEFTQYQLGAVANQLQLALKYLEDVPIRVEESAAEKPDD